jgi:hypothetical protein
MEKSTLDAGLGKIVGVSAGSGGAGQDAGVGRGVGVVQIGGIPGAF